MTIKQRETFLLKDSYRVKGCLLKAFADVVKQKSREAYKKLRHFVLIGRSRNYITQQQGCTIMTNAYEALKGSSGE